MSVYIQYIDIEILCGFIFFTLLDIGNKLCKGDQESVYHLSLSRQTLWNLKRTRFGVGGKARQRKLKLKTTTLNWIQFGLRLENVPQCIIVGEQLESRLEHG